MSRKISDSLKLQQPFLVLLTAALALGAGYSIAQATLSSGPAIISAPAIISDDAPGAVNTQQQAFDERQEVTLTEDVRCDTSIIPAGEVVNSHMIFFNTQFLSPETDANRTWTFEDEIICVMSNRNGLYQAQTDHFLGAPGTSYPGPFASRGLESDDSYTVNGNQIVVTMTAEEPGDWIRVLTRVQVQADTTPPVVYCDAGSNPGGKTQEKKEQSSGSDKEIFVELIGADETDGAVDLYLTDSESGIEFGPFAPGTQVQLVEAKGATPQQTPGSGTVEYRIRTNGEVMISATDEAGNEGSSVCS